MSDRYLYKAKRKDNGEWVEGYYFCMVHTDGRHAHHFIIPLGADLSKGRAIDKIQVEVDPATICQCTELPDKNGKLIWENDITKLVMPDGEIRYFKVSFKKVIRKVLNHPDFYDDVAKVELNAICFEWHGYELFPCIDENGVSDISKMEVVGNIFDNPSLLEGGAE